MFLLKKAILATQCHCLNTLPVNPLFIRKCFSLMFEGQVFIFCNGKSFISSTIILLPVH